MSKEAFDDFECGCAVQHNDSQPALIKPIAATDRSAPENGPYSFWVLPDGRLRIEVGVLGVMGITYSVEATKSLKDLLDETHRRRDGAPALNTCKDCKHFDAGQDSKRPYGRCRRWITGYDFESELSHNEVQVENDEGWAMVMGPDFGCVLWEVEAS
jgi:hypothetical protein